MTWELLCSDGSQRHCPIRGERSHDLLFLHQIPKPDPKPTTYKRRIQSTKSDASGKVLKNSTTKLPSYLGSQVISASPFSIFEHRRSCRRSW